LVRRRFWHWGLVLSLLAALGGGAAVWHRYLRWPPVSTAAIESYYRALPVRPSQPVDPERLRAATAAANDYILRTTASNGRLTYLVNANPAVPVTPGYSMLRHAGTIYALGMAHPVVSDPRQLEVMRRAVSYMRQCCFARFAEDGRVGMWEPPEVMLQDLPREYKLGAVGLALAALASTHAVDPGAVDVDEMRGLARMGRYLMRWNGDFYPRFAPDRGGRADAPWVLFYPGEMTLGWLMLYERAPAPELIEWSVKALSHMARERAVDREAPADHWALLATARLFRIADKERLDIPRQALFDHALQIVHTMLEGSFGSPRSAAIEGTLVASGRGEVTPTSTRLEALLSALEILPRDHPITPHVVSAVYRGLDFVLRSQIKSGPHAGGIPAALIESGNAADAASEFDRLATEVRIDFVQHALSAMVQYELLQLPSRR
jgi:hypothetical protein